jgi:hypothetical protein
MSQSARLKVNWFPVQVPLGTLRVLGLITQDKPDRGAYEAYPHVRQYPHDGQWLAVCVSQGKIPLGFRDLEIDVFDIPRMTSTLISEAFLLYYEQQDFKVERGKGQNNVYRQRYVSDLPESLTFYEGLLLKPFYFTTVREIAFGLVIDFATHQEFTRSIEDDPIQMRMAQQGYEVFARYESGAHISGLLRNVRGDMAQIEWHGRMNEVPVNTLRIKANYEYVSEYFNSLKPGQSRKVIRLLMVESLSLSKTGFANVDRLLDQYQRVAELLGRKQNSNINIPLPTPCQSVISIATAPADLELRQI